VILTAAQHAADAARGCSRTRRLLTHQTAAHATQTAGAAPRRAGGKQVTYTTTTTSIHHCRRASIASQRRHARRQHCGGAGGAPGRPSWPGRAPPQLVPKLSLSGTVNDGDRLVVVVAFLQKTFVCLYIHTYILGRNTGGWQQQRRATSSTTSRCRYEYGNDDGRLHQGKGSARASHPEAGPAHIRATSLPLSVPRRSLLSRSYLVWGAGPPFRAGGFLRRERLWLRSDAGRAQLANSRVTGPVLAASSTSEMLCRPQWSRSGLSESYPRRLPGSHHLHMSVYIVYAVRAMAIQPVCVCVHGPK
jgi:hypothetical protein